MATVIGLGLFLYKVVSNSEAAYVQAQVMWNARVAMVSTHLFLDSQVKKMMYKELSTHNIFWKLTMFFSTMMY
jgi:hypothetical protein